MYNESQKVIACIVCGRPSKRHSTKKKLIHTEKGDTFLLVSKHYCASCDKYFTNPSGEKYAPLRRKVSWGLIFRAIEIAESMTLEKACRELRRQTGYGLSPTTLHDWVTNSDNLKERHKKISEMTLGKEL